MNTVNNTVEQIKHVIESAEKEGMNRVQLGAEFGIEKVKHVGAQIDQYTRKKPWMVVTAAVLTAGVMSYLVGRSNKHN